MSVMRCEMCHDQYIDTDYHVESWVTLRGKLDKYGTPEVRCWCFNCQERHADEIDEDV